jgi:transcriptional regulator with XRE-family HTH domain
MPVSRYLQPVSMTLRKATEIDAQIGARVRDRRMLSGITQTGMGLAVGVSAQQVQKYENGKSRISAGRLLIFAHILGTNVSEFYAGLENWTQDFGSEDQSAVQRRKFILTREGIRLISGYLSIKDRRVRMSVLRLLETNL